MDPPQGVTWPEAGPSSAPMNPTPFPSVLMPADPVPGPSSILLNSPRFVTPHLPPAAAASDPSAAQESVGRGRGRGRGRGLRGLRGVGRGRGRGRGARGGVGGTGIPRQSGRMTTRAGHDGAHSKVKISFKMNASGAGEASGGRMTSFLGDYDRELDDNPEEPLEFEEQFILRVPKEVAEGRKGEPGLREIIKGKGLEGLEMKFMDSRRAAVKINGTTYSSKLVDLPCIIESQKTHDSRHLFKVADISQMLVVGPQIASEASIPSGVQLNQDEYVWPHGITPPLRHVRKRRFRKRLSRTTIEQVEKEVEELLKRDKEAGFGNSTYELLDAPDLGMPDSYFETYDPNAPPPHEINPSEYSYGDPGSAKPSEAQWGEEDGEEGGEDDDAEGEEDEFDQELAHALMEQMGGDSGESEDEDGFDEGDADDADEAGEDEDEDEDEDDEETIEKKAKIRQFASEIKQLEAAIEKKRAGFQGGNPIMIKRFEETIAGMMNDINTKAVARQVLVDELERAKPVEPTSSADQNATPGEGGTPAGAPAVYSDDDDDLFGEADDGGGVDVPQTSTAQDTPRSMDADGEDDAGSVMEQDADGEEVGTDIEVEGEDADGEGDEEEEEDDENDELAAMLEAEMGGTPAEPTETQDETAALEAIDSMELQDDIEELGDIVLPSSPAVGSPLRFSTTEGGVGNRRLVEGAEEWDSGSSDDSDD